MKIVISSVLVCLLASARSAPAQTVTTPEPLGRVTVTCDSANCESPAAVLTRHLSRGDMVKLQGYASELLQTLAKTGPEPLRAALGNVKRNYYRLIWMGRDDSGASAVQSAVVHVGARDAIRTLPGVTTTSSVQLIDVFISADASAVVDTQVVSTSVKDPLLAQIPGFIEKTGLIGFVAGLPIGRGEALDAKAPTTYTVARPLLPMARADLKIKDTVITPGSAAGLRRSSTELRDRLSTRDVRLSPCAQSLAAADAEAVAKGLAQPACTITREQPAGLTTPEVNACRTVLSGLLEEAFTKASACRDPDPAPGGDAVLLVDKQFSDLIGGMKETRKSAESKLANTPRTHYNFGVLSGAVVGTPSYRHFATRAKVGGNGALIADPMPTVMTMMLVNIHPRGYDPQRDSASASERFRLFAGTVVTPDFGVGAGGGVMIVRGLSVNAGWANLFVKTPGSGLSIGQTPGAGKTALKIGNAGVWFLGLSYSFK
jgi:hypothetical protein